MTGSNSRDDGQAAPAALQPPVDRSVCRLVVAPTKPIWVLEGALMGKAISEGVHGAAEFTKRTKKMPLASGMALSALRIHPLLPPMNRASAALALALYSAGVLATRRSAALRKRAPSAYSVEVIWSSWHPRGAAEAFYGKFKSSNIGI